MKQTLFILFSMFFIFSCSEKKRDKNVFINGTFTGGNGQMVKLSEMTTNSIIPVDSAVVKNNDFRLSADISETAFFLLQFEDGPPFTLVLSPGEEATFDFDASDRSTNYRIEGNHHSLLLMDYFNKTGAVRKKLDSLRQVLYESQALPEFFEIKTSIDATLDSLLDDHKTFTRNLIESNPSSPATILLINKSFAGSQLFTLKDHLDLFQLIDDNLVATAPENSHVALHHRRVVAALKKIEQALKAEKRTSPGQVVPAIQLYNSEGKQMALHDLKGKTALLFFWAAWSPESRADLQLLKEIYHKSGYQDFEVFAVSLDHRAHFWKAALDVEKTQWINVNDPSGLGGSLAQLFNLPQKLPYYFVIDPQGVIQLKTDRFALAKAHLQELK